MTLEEIPRDRVGGSTGRANVLHQQREEDIGLILGRLGPGALEGRAVAREVVLQPGLGADAARVAGGEETARGAGGVRPALPRLSLARGSGGAHGGGGGTLGRARPELLPSGVEAALLVEKREQVVPGRAHAEQATVRVGVARRARHGLVGLARQRVNGRAAVDGAQLERGARRRRGRVGGRRERPAYGPAPAARSYSGVVGQKGPEKEQKKRCTEARGVGVRRVPLRQGPGYRPREVHRGGRKEGRRRRASCGCGPGGGEGRPPELEVVAEVNGTHGSFCTI